MSNAAKVNEFLDKAQVFYFLTTDGDQPKGRPFGFHLLEGDRLYFGCGTFKKVFHQLDLRDANIINDPYFYLQQNDVVYVEPNKVKARNSAIGTSTTLAFSGVSVLISLSSLIVNILR